MKILHTALSVKSIHDSQKFFEVVFGLHPKVKGERPELGVKFLLLEDKSGGVIELIEHNASLPLTEDLMNFQQIGFKHVAFAVEDIDLVLEKALANGAKIVSPIKKGIIVKRSAFITDPDGLPIELSEV